MDIVLGVFDDRRSALEAAGDGTVVVSPMWGGAPIGIETRSRVGLSRCTSGGEERQVEWRELDDVERRTAINGYREAHPLYSRMILRMLVRVNRFEGDPEEALLREVLPMLGLRRADPAV